MSDHSEGCLYEEEVSGVHLLSCVPSGITSLLPLCTLRVLPYEGPEMVNWAAKRKRREDVKDRANEPSATFSRCRVVGCSKPARAGTQDGLDTRFCRSHADHYSRHGSPYKRSYTAKEIAPHRKAAEAWLRANEGDTWVRNAVDRVRTLYATAGPHVEAFRLRGLSPEERARAAWATLRTAKVDPMKVVAACVAVEMTIAADPQPDSKSEFKRVQAAKLIHKWHPERTRGGRGAG